MTLGGGVTCTGGWALVLGGWALVLGGVGTCTGGWALVLGGWALVLGTFTWGGGHLYCTGGVGTCTGGVGTQWVRGGRESRVVGISVTVSYSFTMKFCRGTSDWQTKWDLGFLVSGEKSYNVFFELGTLKFPCLALWNFPAWHLKCFGFVSCMMMSQLCYVNKVGLCSGHVIFIDSIFTLSTPFLTYQKNTSPMSHGHQVSLPR